MNDPFFVSGENDLTELHMCMRKRNEANTLWEQTWLCMELNRDFKDILTKYGRLPETNTTLNEFMEMMDERDQQRKKIWEFEVQVKKLESG